MSFRNPKSKKGYRTVMARAKQIIKSKKFFSRNTPPTCNVHLTSRDFYLRKNKKVCLGFSQGRPPHAKSTPYKQCSQGRRRKRRPLLPLCAGCTKTSSKFCATLPIDFFPKLWYNNYRNNNRITKILKNFLSNTTILL